MDGDNIRIKSNSPLVFRLKKTKARNDTNQNSFLKMCNLNPSQKQNPINATNKLNVNHCQNIVLGIIYL